METKVSQIGNSLGVILPKEVIGKLHLKKGDSLTLHVTEGDKGIFLTPGKGFTVDETFARKVSEFSEQYQADLKRLAE